MTLLVATIAIAVSAPGLAQMPRHRHAPTAPGYPPAPPPAAPNLHAMQYLYGSGEAAALTRQTWHALVGYVATAVRAPHRRGVVLTPAATLAAPAFVDCGDKPPAAVFDVDETVVLNLGAEYDDLASGRAAFDAHVWNRWERSGGAAAAPTPGAKAALDALRAMGVAVIFNTNRAAANAAQTQAMLDRLGLGPAAHGDTLYLSGDDSTGSLKDGRRQRIAARFCVLAMAGDQLGDFTDRFNTDPQGLPDRRADTGAPAIAALWGNGWFVMPNPVYGAAVQGGADDIFPEDKQWRDPGTAAPKEHRR